MQEHVVTLNHNSAECIKATTNWGETIYRNICSDTSVHVAWGLMDYYGVMLIAAFSIILATLIVMAFKEMSRSW